MTEDQSKNAFQWIANEISRRMDRLDVKIDNTQKSVDEGFERLWKEFNFQKEKCITCTLRIARVDTDLGSMKTEKKTKEERWSEKWAGLLFFGMGIVLTTFFDFVKRGIIWLYSRVG